MIAPARPRPGRGDSARGLGLVGLALALWLIREGWEPSRTERLGLLSADTCSRRESQGNRSGFPASLRNKSGRPWFVKILGPPTPFTSPALRFLPALS